MLLGFATEDGVYFAEIRSVPGEHSHRHHTSSPNRCFAPRSLSDTSVMCAVESSLTTPNVQASEALLLSSESVCLLHHVADREFMARSAECGTKNRTAVNVRMPVFSKGNRFHDASISSHRAWTVQRRVGEGQSAEVYSVRCDEEPALQVRVSNYIQSKETCFCTSLK